LLNEYKDMMTVKELSQALRIGKNAAYGMVNQGVIPSLKNGRTYLIPKQYVIDYLNSQRYNIKQL